MGSGHGGRREGSGRKARPDPALTDAAGQHSGPTSFAERECYARILEALNAEKPEKDTPEIVRWRKLADHTDPRIVLDTLKYLYDKRDGKAIQPVDVDATLDHGVIIDLGPLMPKEFRGKPGKAPNR